MSYVRDSDTGLAYGNEMTPADAYLQSFNMFDTFNYRFLHIMVSVFYKSEFNAYV